MPLHATLKVPQNEMSFEVLKKKTGRNPLGTEWEENCPLPRRRGGMESTGGERLGKEWGLLIQQYQQYLIFTSPPHLVCQCRAGRQQGQKEKIDKHVL